MGYSLHFFIHTHMDMHVVPRLQSTKVRLVAFTVHLAKEIYIMSD